MIDWITIPWFLRATPILTGKDAIRFEKMIKDNEKRKVK